MVTGVDSGGNQRGRVAEVAERIVDQLVADRDDRRLVHEHRAADVVAAIKVGRVMKRRRIARTAKIKHRLGPDQRFLCGADAEEVDSGTKHHRVVVGGERRVVVVTPLGFLRQAVSFGVLGVAARADEQFGVEPKDADIVPRRPVDAVPGPA